MPDIDMDFDDRYRDEMIRYTAETYGREHVAQIITFSTIKARAAVRTQLGSSATPMPSETKSQSNAATGDGSRHSTLGMF